jgi:hypothetical protein
MEIKSDCSREDQKLSCLIILWIKEFHVDYKILSNRWRSLVSNGYLKTNTKSKNPPTKLNSLTEKCTP